MTLAYTLGAQRSYDASLRGAKPPTKLGRQAPTEEEPDGYLGGWVWQTPWEAAAFRWGRGFREAFPDRDPGTFAVYELEIPGTWEASVEVCDNGANYLLVDAVILRRWDFGPAGEKSDV